MCVLRCIKIIQYIPYISNKELTCLIYTYDTYGYLRPWAPGSSRSTRRWSSPKEWSCASSLNAVATSQGQQVCLWAVWPTGKRFTKTTPLACKGFSWNFSSCEKAVIWWKLTLLVGFYGEACWDASTVKRKLSWLRWVWTPAWPTWCGRACMVRIIISPSFPTVSRCPSCRTARKRCPTTARTSSPRRASTMSWEALIYTMFTHTRTHTGSYWCIYIYIQAHTHTHTYIYIYT